MKIIPLADFLQLPPGTIYSHLDGTSVDGLFRKGAVVVSDKDGTTPIDFYQQELTAQVFWSGGKVRDRMAAVNPGYGDLTMWDDDDEFAVYEPADIAAMVALLTGSP